MTICPRCQNLFNPSKTQIYCSEYCRRKAQKLRNRRRHAHPRPPKPRPIARPRWRRPKIWAYKPTLEERLLALSIPEPNSGCLLWLGKVSKKGYAVIWLEGRHRVANRAAFEVWKGPIPAGKMVCHHCDIPSCIEPNHLYAGTAKSNHDDMVKRGRHKFPPPRPRKPKPLPKFAGEGI